MGYEVSGVSVCGSRYRADFRWRNEDGSLSPRIRRMLSGTDRESAVEEAEWMALHDLSPISDSSISLGEAIEEYIASKEGEVSPLTAKGYRGSLGKMARASRRIVAMPLRELEPSHIRNYEDARLRKGASPNTVRKEHSLIAAALDAAVASGGIRSNPAREVSPPEKRLRERAVPEDAGRALSLVSSMQGRIGLSASLAVDARATACQVAALEWGDLDCGLAAGRIVRRISPEHGVVVAYAKPRTFETSPATRKKLDLAYAASRREGRACAGDRLFDIFPEAMAREFNAVAKVVGLSASFSTLRQLRGD